MTLPALLVRRIAETDYLPCWQAMKALTDARTPHSPDELWVVEHPPVFTLGQAGKPEHILGAGAIPVVQCDRGGQVTYHGPGQTVIYLLLDLHRMGIGARALVTGIEQAIIAMLADLGLTANSKPDAPGVYLDGAKIASLGLRIRHGRSYHGLSLNRAMDMAPYQRINPCGYAGQPMTSLALLSAPHERRATEDALLAALATTLDLSLPDQALTTLPDAPPAATLTPDSSLAAHEAAGETPRHALTQELP
ncbi:MAG: lipoyl(octanoyl) transferase LipB [Alcanivorax sp.]|nr:lipoyl(octanoyl) transferase LipB [Alcanivorax sp.]